MSARPALFAVPPGACFAERFAAGFWARHGAAPPEAVARVTVFVNTARALAEIERALADRAPGGAALLPRLRLVDGIGEDPLSLPETPPAVDPLRRQLRLLRLVERYLETEREARSPLSAAPELAESLADLLDELDEAGVAPDALDGLAEPEHAGHWRRTLGFVDIVRRHWPAIRAEAEGGAPDPKARQRAAVAALAAAWAAAPPADPVLAAGSTGSVPSTALLLAAIARLPRGGVVLPDFQPGLPADIRDAVAGAGAPEHPMAPFAGLLARLRAGPGDVAPWETGAAEPRPARARLLAQALRPAPVTDAWAREAPALAPEAAEATAGLALVEAPSPRAEAAAAAAAVRRAVETPGRRVAVVTPDRALARRVTAELARFGIVPDDALGRPLAETPPGVFLRLVAEVALGGRDPVALAALLSHPLCRAGTARAAHRAFAEAYERAVLRARGAEMPGGGRLPPWPKPPEGGEAWRAGIEAALAPLARAADGPLGPLAEAHAGAAAALSREAADAAPALWEEAAGEAVREAMAALARAGDAHGAEPVRDYRALLLNRLGAAEIRPRPEAPHARVAILGPREARNHPAEVLVLAGLNEGTWPAPPGAEPWLSRPMRETLGLAPPEARLGLAAHDFLAAALREEVVLTRAARAEGAPTVPARWLVRLETLLGGLGGGEALEAMRKRGAGLLELSAHTHRPACAVPRAPRPAPRPPAGARPRRLSVTEVETLVRDPYAVYARHVLRLRPLDPLGSPPDLRDRGMVIHEAMRRFVADTWEGLPPDDGAAERAFRAAVEAVLADAVPWPGLRRAWSARMARAAPWLIAWERRRRAAGRPGALEVKGAMTVDTAAGPVELTARADRIDLLGAGTGAIVDYKTGTPPTAKQIGEGFNLQLHLEGAILAAGGFEGLPAVTPETGAFVGLTGSARDGGGKATELENLGAEVPARLGELGALLAAYATDAPFRSRTRMEREGAEADYDHLARRAEWEADA